MYMQTKEVGCKENCGIKTISIEDCKGNIIVDKRQVLTIWENYVTELYDWPNRPENQEVDPEEKVDADEKGPYMSQREVEKSINEMNDKMAARDDDDVPENILKLRGEEGLRIITKLRNTIWKLVSGPRILLKL